MNLWIISDPSILPSLSHHTPKLLDIATLIATASNARSRHGESFTNALLVIVVKSAIGAHGKVVVHSQEKRVAALGRRSEHRTTQHLCPSMHMNDGAAKVTPSEQVTKRLMNACVPHTVAYSIKPRRVAVDGRNAETHRFNVGFGNLVANGTLTAKEDNFLPI